MENINTKTTTIRRTLFTLYNGAILDSGAGIADPGTVTTPVVDAGTVTGVATEVVKGVASGVATGVMPLPGAAPGTAEAGTAWPGVATGVVTEVVVDNMLVMFDIEEVVSVINVPFVLVVLDMFKGVPGAIIAGEAFTSKVACP